MTTLTEERKVKSRTVNWMTASLLAIWVVLVSLAAESLGEPQQSARQIGEQSMLLEQDVDQAICRMYNQARDLLDS